MGRLRRWLNARAATSPAAARAAAWIEWLRPPRQLKTTTLGKLVIAFTIVIGVAATNTGNNLLYLVLGGLFGLVAASGVLSERVLKRLDAQLFLPEVLVAGRGSVCAAELRSGKNVDSFLLWTELVDADERTLSRVFVRDVPAGGRRHVGFAWTPSRRGAHPVAGIRLRTRFPFQMYEKSRLLERPGVLWVAPEPAAVDLPRGVHATTGSSARQSRAAEGSEFHGLRERLPSDPPSRIHWKRSATVGEHLVKIFRAEHRPVLVVGIRAGHDDEDFEDGLCQAAGYLDAARRREVPVRLELGARRVWDPDGQAGWRRTMRALAQVVRADVPPGGPVVALRVERS